MLLGNSFSVVLISVCFVNQSNALTSSFIRCSTFGGYFPKLSMYAKINRWFLFDDINMSDLLF